MLHGKISVSETATAEKLPATAGACAECVSLNAKLSKYNSLVKAKIKEIDKYKSEIEERDISIADLNKEVTELKNKITGSIFKLFV